jgi:hypothetical protein
MDIEKIGWEGVDWINLVHDRAQSVVKLPGFHKIPGIHWLSSY